MTEGEYIRDMFDDTLHEWTVGKIHEIAARYNEIPWNLSLLMTGSLFRSSRDLMAAVVEKWELPSASQINKDLEELQVVWDRIADQIQKDTAEMEENDNDRN